MYVDNLRLKCLFFLLLSCTSSFSFGENSFIEGLPGQFKYEEGLCAMGTDGPKPQAGCNPGECYWTGFYVNLPGMQSPFYTRVGTYVSKTNYCTVQKLDGAGVGSQYYPVSQLSKLGAYLANVAQVIFAQSSAATQSPEIIYLSAQGTMAGSAPIANVVATTLARLGAEGQGLTAVLNQGNLLAPAAIPSSSGIASVQSLVSWATNISEEFNAFFVQFSIAVNYSGSLVFGVGIPPAPFPPVISFDPRSSCPGLAAAVDLSVAMQNDATSLFQLMQKVNAPVVTLADQEYVSGIEDLVVLSTDTAAAVGEIISGVARNGGMGCHN